MYILGISLLFTLIIVIERCMHVFIALLRERKMSSGRKYASMNVLVLIFNNITIWTRFMLDLFVGSMQWLVQKAFWILVILGLMTVLSILMEIWPNFMPNFVIKYNDGLGSFLRLLIIFPLQMFELFVSHFIVFFNAVVWIVKGVLGTVIFPEIKADFITYGYIPRAGTSLGLLAKEVTISFSNYAINVAGCAINPNAGVIMNKAGSSGLAVNVTKSVECFEPGLTQLDLITPARHFRDSVMFVVKAVKGSCELADVVLDIVTFPISDFNLYESLHLFVNSLLLLVVQTPYVTVHRCNYAKDLSTLRPIGKLVMCLPDIKPPINYMVGAFRYFGNMFDNWLDMLLVILEQFFTGKSPGCDPVPIQMSYDSEDYLIFGNRYRTLVGLTNGMYAITDGISTQYEIFYKKHERQIVLNNWPFPVDPLYGIAAVRYGEMPEIDDGGDYRTGMLGCECLDTSSGVQITCAIAPYIRNNAIIRQDGYVQEVIDYITGSQDYSEVAGNSSQFLGQKIPLVFSIPTTSKYATCERLKISVQSLRWPQTRISAIDTQTAWNAPTPDRTKIIDLAKEMQADAVIYVVPRCVSSGAVDPLCLPGFAGASCYPYCFGLHVTGTTNQGIVLYDAQDWKQSVQFLKRDCGVSLSSVAGELEYVSYLPTNGPAGSQVDPLRVVVTNDVLNGSVSSQVWDPTVGCVPSSVINSRLNKDVVSEQTADVADNTDGLGVILLRDQPFVVAGDVILTAYPASNAIDNTGYVIKVDRIFGNDMMTYQLITLPQNIPGGDICFACNFDQEQKARVGVEYAYQAYPSEYNPSTVSEWGVFYATNPNLWVYQSNFEYCQDGIARFQIQTTSSFGKITVWMFNAFEVNKDWGNQVNTWEFKSFSPSTNALDCGAMFNVSVVALEYINEQNVAVTVLEADMRSVDVFTRLPKAGATGFRYKIYFINPTTKAGPSTEMFFETEPQSLLAQGKLCPNQRRMPKLGSVFGESVAGLLLFLRLPLNAVFIFPAIFSSSDWDRITDCMPVTYQHSLLLNCGKDILNVDSAFDAWGRSAFLFANGFVQILQLTEGMIGNAGIGLFLTASGVLKGMSKVNSKQNSGAPAGVDGTLNQADAGRQLSRGSNGLAFTLPPWLRQYAVMFLGAAGGFQIFLRFMEKLIIEYIIKLGHGKPIETSFFVILYDMSTDIDELLIQNVNDMCDGFSMVWGYTNPIATMIRHTCRSGTATVQVMLNLLNVFFVDYPILDCVCRGSQGTPFKEYMQDKCYFRAPNHYKPLLNMMVNKGFGQQKATCDLVVQMSNKDLTEAIYPLTTELDKAFSAVGSSLDYLLFMLDPQSGTCANYYTSDYVIAIVPDPTDYFFVCGTTQVCRSRCLDEFQAFESERDLIAGSGKDLTFTSQAPVTFESMFFSQDDILKGKNRAPFEVMALIELNGCNRLCYGSLDVTSSFSQPDRCFMVTGVNSNLQLEFRGYCVPADPRIGLYESALITDLSDISKVGYVVAGSEAWTGDIYRVYFVSKDHLDTLGKRNVVLVAFKDSVKVIADGYVASTIYEVSSKGSVPMDAIDDVFVFPREGMSYILVKGTRKVDLTEPTTGRTIKQTTSVCALISFNAYQFSFSTFMRSSSYSVSYCSARENIFKTLERYYLVCTGQDCDQVVAIPMNNGYSVMTCERKSPDYIECTDLESDPVLAYQSTIASDIGVQNQGSRVPIWMSQNNVAIRRSQQISQTCVTNSSLVTDLKHMSIFVSGSALSRDNWISDIRLDLSSARWVGQQASSSIYQMNMTLVSTCSVKDCSGCRGYMQLQRMCYAAAQCAVAKCIGTTINFQRPLCAVGKLLEEMLRTVLLMLQNAYLVMTDVMKIVVNASTGQIQNQLEITFPDEAFFTTICQSKDILTDTVGILMSTVNGIVIKTKQFMDASSASLKPSDDRFNARMTLTSASMTNLFSQFLMLPLYVLIASQKTIVCTANSLFAVMNLDALGNFQLTIGNANQREVSSQVAGTCLTELVQQDMQNIGYGDAKKNLASSITQLINNMYTAFKLFPMEPVIHNIDAVLTYIVGVINGMMDVIQVLDEQDCKLPDLTTNDLGRCACKDKGHRIAADRRSEGVNQMAFWCTGVLQIVRPNGKPQYVFNPYTYEELVEVIAVSMDQYLDCLATTQDSCSSLKPRMTQISKHSQDRLDYQGVDVATVFSRCRSNYVNKMWDIGAQQIMNIDNQKDLQPHRNWISRYLNLQLIPQSIKDCFHNVLNYGSNNDVCLQDYLLSLNTKRSYYFMYEKTDLDSSTASISQIDACEVFTGPASNPDASVLFKQCVQGNGIDDNCVLPHYIWSGRTTNKVPVANDHGVSFPFGSDNLYDYIDGRMADIRKEIVSLLNQPELLNWDNPRITTEIFSMEKDILHQMFDCLMLGPYSSAEFWPTGAQGMLPTMKYYRKSEDSREFEMPSPDCVPGVDSCCPLQSPYSCGGPARRAIIHTFVHRMKEDTGVAKSIIKDGVRQKISDLRTLFSTGAAYGCDCQPGDAIGTGVNVRCCKGKEVSQFASTAMQGFSFDMVGSDEISSAMFDEIKDYVHDSIWNNETLYKEHLPGWTAQDFQRAVDESFFDVETPVLNYDFNDVAAPRVNATLWKFCTALISQAFFTLPLTDDLKAIQFPSTSGSFQYEPVQDPSTGFVSGIQQAVDHILSQARDKSPFFRHYSTRYMPSKSLMCKNRTKTEVSSLRAEDMLSATGDMIELGGNLNLYTPEASPVLAYFGRYEGLRFNDYHSRCFCNWNLGGVCRVPPSVCSGVDIILALASGVQQGSIDRFLQVCTSENGYYLGQDDLAIVMQVATAGWQKEWVCDEMMISDHWGIVDDTYIDLWLGGKDYKTYNWRDLLVSGNSGLRVGNLQYAASNVQAVINPKGRAKPIMNFKNKQSIALEHCIEDDNYDNSKNGWLDFVGDLSRVHQYFVDSLFPIAQTVYTSAPEAFCTRYIIELARLRALEYVDALRSYQDPTPETSNQRIIVDLWRQRCVTQVRSIGLCELRGVYYSKGNQSYSHCPFVLVTSQLNQHYSNWYVTPGCIVYTDGRFTDPCKCSLVDTCNILYGYDMIESGSCDLSIDPRAFVDESQTFFSSMHWPTTFLPEEVHDILSQAEMERLASEHESYMQTAVNDFPMSESDLQDLRNTVAASSVSEGLLMDEFCDVMLDYWPEDWYHPVGYHVSTLCTHDDTAFRGFDSWMRVEYDSDLNEKYLVLESQRLRNATLGNNYFGTQGVCDTSNYAMPLFEINNMRLQSRWRDNQLCDPTQPLRCNVSSQEDYVISKPSSSLLDVPMHTSEGDAVMDSSPGLLRHWYQEYSGVWPSLFDSSKAPRYRLPNSQSSQTSSWGDSCGMMDLIKCRSDEDCNSLKTSTSQFKCLTPDDVNPGVCFKASEIECYQHRHCQGSKMCDGGGRCVEPFLGLDNDLIDYDVEFSFNSEKCDIEVLGSSPWQNVPDFLPRSGVCSFRNWYEAANFQEKAGMLYGQLNGYAYQLDSQDISWHDTRPSVTLEESQLPIFDRDIMKMQPHTCDMNYEYAFKSCSNQPAWKVGKDGSYSSSTAEKGNTSRTYVPRYNTLGNIIGWDIQMCKLPYVPISGNPRTTIGFLNPYVGPADNLDSFTDISNRMKMCSDYNLCYLQQFYVEGYRVDYRKVVRQEGVVPYEVRDALQCGPFAQFYKQGLTTDMINTQETCKLDPYVLPFLKMFCEDYTNLQGSCELDSQVTSNKDEICRIYFNRYHYSKSGNILGLVNNLLWKLFIRGFNTWREYQSRVRCVNFMWLRMSSYTDALDGVDWYQVETEPGSFLTVKPLRTIYTFTENALMEVPFKWWVKCVILDDTVDLAPLINQNIRGVEVISCRNWNPTEPPVTLKDILQQTDALFEDQVNSEQEMFDITLNIYDTLNAILDGINLGLMSQMQFGANNDKYKVSYIEARAIITANDLYRSDDSYRQFVLSSQLPNDPNDAVVNTVPLLTDSGSYPFLQSSKSIFEMVKNYLLHGQIDMDYFSSPNLYNDKYKKAKLSFTSVIEDGKQLSEQIGDFYNSRDGVVYYRFDRLSTPVTEEVAAAELQRIASQFKLESLVDVSNLDPEDPVFASYASQVLEIKNGVKVFKQSKCVNPDVFAEGYPDHRNEDANVQVCDSSLGRCRYINICPGDSQTYDARTGQSCNLQYRSKDDIELILNQVMPRSDIVETDFFYQRDTVKHWVDTNQDYIRFSGEYSAHQFIGFGRPAVSISTGLGDTLPEVCYRSDVYRNNPDFCGYQNYSLISQHIGKICIRTDSSCLGNSSVSVEVASALDGVELMAFYRLNPTKKNPNDASFYSDIRKRIIREIDPNLADYYPAWIDCHGAFGEVKGQQMYDKFVLTEEQINRTNLFANYFFVPSKWDQLNRIERSDGTTRQTYQYTDNKVYAIRDVSPGYFTLAVIDSLSNDPSNREQFDLLRGVGNVTSVFNDAIWRLEDHRPLGVTKLCSGRGSCDLRDEESSVYAVAIRLNEMETFYCSKDVEEAKTFCPGSDTYDSIVSEVYKNYYYCMQNCTKVPILKYHGKNSYLYRGLKNINSYPDISVKSSESNGFTFQDAFKMVHDMVLKELESMGGIYSILPPNLLDTIWTRPSLTSTIFMQAGARYTFPQLNLLSMYNYDDEGNNMKRNGFDSCTGNEIDYLQCNNPLHETLRECNERMKIQRSYVANAKEKLVWQSKKDYMTSKHTMFWSNKNRPQRDRFLDWILSSSRCLENTQSDAVCYADNNGYVRTINPWLAGDFNFYEGCDTTINEGEFSTVIDAFCPSYFGSSCSRYNEYLSSTQCLQKNNRNPLKQDVRSNANNNLCQKSVRENTTCLHHQNVFGGSFGETMTDLHSRPSTTLVYTGFFGSSPHPSYRKDDVEYILGQSLNDIGGTFVVARLQRSNDTVGDPVDDLQISCMPLYYTKDSQDRPMLGSSDLCQGKTKEFLNSYVSDRISDITLNTLQVGSKSLNNEADWSCPIKEMEFWSGRNPNFKPTFPSGKRSAIMFGGINHMGDTLQTNPMSHPIQFAGQEMYHLADAVFVSEICSCGQDMQSCLTCDLQETADFLFGQSWKAKVHKQGSKCEDSLDWPSRGGTLRDGSELPAQSVTSSCDINDRLRQYEMRYVTIPFSEQRTAEGKTTLDQGGACHMGRLAKIPSSVPLGSRCSRFNLTTLKCINTLHTSNPVEFVHLDIDTSLGVKEQIARATTFKRKCNGCQTAPKTKKSYVRGSGDEALDSIEAKEISFGVPVKISTSRMLAMDLRRHICGDLQDCSLESEWLDDQYWNVDRFTVAYLDKVSDLFKIKVNPISTDASRPAVVNDTELWDRKWVFCTEYGNNNKVQCFGNVSKQNWKNSNVRYETCKSEILTAVPDNKAAVPIRICNLDSTMNNLCRFIQQKKQEIYTLNCMAAGQCMDTAFLYNPSAYSISNEKFIVETVNDFYSNIDATACSVSATTQEIIAQNNVLKQKCGSTQLVPLRDSISYIRRIVQSITKIMYYYYMIVFNFIQLLTPVEVVDTDSILANVKVYLDLIISESKRLFNQFGNLVFAILEMTPFGKALMTLVKVLCIAMRYIYEYFILLVVCPILKGIAGFQSFIGDILKGIHDISFLGISPFSWVPYKFAYAVRDLLEKLSPCSETNPFQCDNLHRVKERQDDGTLPTPTRCWASYVSSLGDGSSLSCSASDTCLKSITGSISDTVVCAACPSGYDVASTNKFGCDLVRKQCACTVPIIDRTPCLTHEQCSSQQDASCVFINSDIQQTFGNVPCTQCNNEPLCIIQPGDTYGFCSCTLKKIPFQTCDPAYEGQQVAYSMSGLCLAEMSSTLSFSGGRSSAYTLKYNNLLSTPCFNADSTSLFCYRVYFTATDYQSLLVSQGTAQFSSYTGGVYGRRRLLEFDNELEQSIEFFSHEPGCMDGKDHYLNTGNITRVFQRCLQSYASTLEITTGYGFQTIVPANMFVSLEDFITEVGERPHAFITILSSPPFMLRILHQMHWFKPIRRMIRRVQSVLLDLYIEVVLSRKSEYDDLFHMVVDSDGQFVIHSNQTSYVSLFIINFIHGIGRGNNFSYHELKGIELAMRNRAVMGRMQQIFYDRNYVATLQNMTLTNLTHNQTLRRRLLQYGFERQEVSRFSSTVGFNDGIPSNVGLQTANNWASSYFAWPLVFDYKITTGVCSVLSRLIILVKESFGNASLYYNYGSVLKAQPRTSIRGSFPFSDYVASSDNSQLRTPLNEQDYLQVVQYWIEDRLGDIGLTRQFVVDQCLLLPDLVVDMFKCDKEAVMLCTKHHYTIYVSGVVIGLTYMVVSLVARLFRIPFVDTFLFWTYPFLVMYYAYGYAPTCIPMVPTCFISDVLSFFDWLLPERFFYPNSLQTSNGCIDNANITDKDTCVRSCQSYGFEYSNIDANIAWYLCSYSVKTCRDFSSWYYSQSILPKFKRFKRLVAQKAMILESKDGDAIFAQDLCALVTSWKFIPLIVLFSFLLFVIAFLIGLPFQLLGGFIQLLLGVIIVSHQ